MTSWLAIALTFCLFADADVPALARLRSGGVPLADFPPAPEIPVLPAALSAEQEAKPQVPPQTQTKAATLRPESRLALVRYVSGEFARALKPLPAGKDGFLLRAGQPFDPQVLDRAVARHGAAVNTGDSAQITRLEFRQHDIIIDINGGGRIKKRWRDRLHMEVGGVPTVRSSTQEGAAPGRQPGTGSTIFLDFGKPLPDLSPAELKQLLAPLLDFSKQHSAAVQWYDTLPPAMKQAIQDRRAAVGMDREMVVAAIGKPERKVRERDAEGNEIEDWIYGQPPAKTIFVRFQGERVTSIKQFPQ
ncbi:MAG: hypothetical protein LAN84_11155 [Acidobacteriia bacterium]|nr:hypothetical protein [Terriglobia bacterium]